MKQEKLYIAAKQLIRSSFATPDTDRITVGGASFDLLRRSAEEYEAARKTEPPEKDESDLYRAAKIMSGHILRGFIDSDEIQAFNAAIARYEAEIKTAPIKPGPIDGGEILRAEPAGTGILVDIAEPKGSTVIELADAAREVVDELAFRQSDKGRLTLSLEAARKLQAAHDKYRRAAPPKPTDRLKPSDWRPEPQEGDVITCTGADGKRRTLGETVRLHCPDCLIPGIEIADGPFRVFARIGDHRLLVYRESAGVPKSYNGVLISGPWIARLVEFQRATEAAVREDVDSEIDWFRENWSG